MKEDAMRSELIQWLEKLEDKSILRSLYFFKNISQEQDWWDELTPSQKEQVEKGLQDAKEGRVVPSEEVWKRYGRKTKC